MANEETKEEMSSEMTDRDVALAVTVGAMRSTLEEPFDVVEMLTSLGREDLVEDAKALIEEEDEESPDDPEPDELDFGAEGE